MSTLRVGLLGCGTVGTPVARALLEEGDALARAAGVRLELAAVAVQHLGRERAVELPPHLLTTDALAVAIDPGIDIVIELIGGIEPALSSIRAALGDNKAVVTANKETLAGAGRDLLDDPGADLYFEASVCGAIPIVRTLKESFAGERIDAFSGIFSGTCNFVLNEITERGCSLDDAVREAQQLGYAEADPTADIEAFDAAAKVAILARVAFGVPAGAEDVARQGITGISPSSIADAASQGLVCKLVGGGRRTPNGTELWVKPEFVPADDPLALVTGADNTVLVETRRAGRVVLNGAGAGGDPTAAAILGDVVSAARRRAHASRLIPCVA